MKRNIIVGIPTYREADTIARSVTQIDCGLERSYGAENCIIVNVDNGSDDQTRDVFLGTKTKCPKEYISTGNSPRGKGKNPQTRGISDIPRSHRNHHSVWH